MAQILSESCYTALQPPSGKKIKKRWGLPPCRGADTVAAPLDMGDVAMGVSGSTAATWCIAILRVTMRVHLPGDKAGPATPGCAEVLL